MEKIHRQQELNRYISVDWKGSRRKKLIWQQQMKFSELKTESIYSTRNDTRNGCVWEMLGVQSSADSRELFSHSCDCDARRWKHSISLFNLCHQMASRMCDTSVMLMALYQIRGNFTMQHDSARVSFTWMVDNVSYASANALSERCFWCVKRPLSTVVHPKCKQLTFAEKRINLATAAVVGGGRVSKNVIELSKWTGHIHFVVDYMRIDTQSVFRGFLSNLTIDQRQPRTIRTQIAVNWSNARPNEYYRDLGQHRLFWPKCFYVRDSGQRIVRSQFHRR